MSFSTVFHSYQDDVRMKGCAQWNLVMERFPPQVGLKSGPLDQKAST